MRALLTATPILLTACHGETINVGPPPPPADRLVCEALPAKPDLTPLTAITLADGRRVYLKSEVDARDSMIARYIVAVEGAWFSCSNQLAWNRDYYAGQE